MDEVFKNGVRQHKGEDVTCPALADGRRPAQHHPASPGEPIRLIDHQGRDKKAAELLLATHNRLKRHGKYLREPPAVSKAAGKGSPGPVPNQRPIAMRAAESFREDLLTFFGCFGRDNVTPRLALLPMLEASIAVGMTTIALSTVALLNQWAEVAAVPAEDCQEPFAVFVDCSGGTDTRLRDYSEQAGMLVRHAMGRISTTLMYMRLLDFWVSTESDIPRSELPARAPDATDWVNLLGRIASGHHDESKDALRKPALDES